MRASVGASVSRRRFARSRAAHAARAGASGGTWTSMSTIFSSTEDFLDFDGAAAPSTVAAGDGSAVVPTLGVGGGSEMVWSMTMGSGCER